MTALYPFRLKKATLRYQWFRSIATIYIYVWKEGRWQLTIKVITKKHPKVMVKYTTFVGMKDSAELAKHY